MPAPVAVARLLLRLLDTVELNVDGVLRDIDTEFLHDLRVAVRRTRSAIKLLGEVLPADLAEHFKAEFKWLGDVTTPVRDLDVHLLGFDALTEQLVAASPADLEPLRAFLARRRAREFRRLAAALRGPRFRAITEDWRKALLEIRDVDGPRRRRPTAAALALSTTGRSFRRIAAQGGAITSDSPPESLHDLRKRAKELRYLLEFFAPLHDPVAYRKVVCDLKQLQDCLGEFQDSEVQRHEIHTLADAMLAERAAPAATLLAMGEIAAKLALSQAEARAEFAARFGRFAGRRAGSASASCSRAAGEDLRHLQHQGRRRQDDRGRQPGLPVRRRRLPDPALGSGPAGRGQLPVPDQAAGQGRRQGAHPRHQDPRRRDQGHRLRPPGPAPRRLHLPQHGPAPRHGWQGGADAKSTRKLGQLLKPMAAEYDHVFLDCPPSISLVSENVMHAADVLLVPLIPTTLSVRTLDQLTEFVAGFNGHRPQVRAFFSMVDRRKKLHQEITRDLATERAGVAATPIPALSMIERMSVERAPVSAFAPRSVAARAYRALWSEVQQDPKALKP